MDRQSAFDMAPRLFHIYFDTSFVDVKKLQQTSKRFNGTSNLFTVSLIQMQLITFVLFSYPYSYV